MPKRTVPRPKTAKTKLQAPKNPDPQLGMRKLYLPKRQWYNPFSWRYAPPVPAYKPLPKARLIFVETVRQLWVHKWLFGGITLTYGVLNILLVRGFSNSTSQTLQSLKTAVDAAMQGITGALTTAFTSFSYLLATSGSGSLQNATMYQYLLLLICSLALIYAVRMTMAGKKIRVRDGFYSGMYPIIPFLLVFLILGVQLLPMIIGGSLYFTGLSTRVLVAFWQKALAFMLFVGLSVWSLRMITGTLLAAYVVTLPDMTPIRAVRSASNLVYGRRWLIWRKLLFLPAVLMLVGILIELPLILWLTPVAGWVFFILTMLALPLAHVYFYRLYREML